MQYPPRLEYVHRMIADGTCSVLALDVFDTVLWRRVPRHTDLYSILGSQLRRSRRCPTWLTDASFRRLRITAEENARAGHPSSAGDVSLFDIWRAMPLSLFAGTDVAELVDAEMRCERALSVVDLDVADVIGLAAENAVPIVLVSDTHFTEDQLSFLVDRPGLEQLKDARILRSRRYGADRIADLRDAVAQQVNVASGDVLYLGDSGVGGQAVPAEPGIRTLRCTGADELFDRILAREGEPVEPFGPQMPFLDDVEGDCGITALRARTLQSRAPSAGSAVATAWRYGAGVLGPVLTGYAEWIVDTAQADGATKVWCPMREGELLAGLINNAAQARGCDVQAEPVWLSRHTTAVAALDCFDPQSMHEYIARGHGLTVRGLLEGLHLRPGDVPSLGTVLDTVLDNGPIIDRVAVALTETPHLQKRLATIAVGARRRLISALRNSGALDGGEILLADLGWAGTIQFQLSRILRLAQLPVAVSGLYLVTDDRAIRLLNAGLRAQGYLAQTGHPRSVADTVTRSPEILEQCVNALCGSLVDFTADGSPILGPSTGTESQDNERRAVQEGILAFQAQWNRYVRTAEDPWPNLAHAGVEKVSNILLAAVRSPTAEEAAVFGDWYHDDNFGSALVTRELPEDLVAAIPYLAPGDLDDLHMRDAFWPRLLAASDPPLSAATRALDAGLIDARAFESAGEPSHTLLRWRTSDDHWHDGPQARVRINHNGLSFARLYLEASDVLDVSLAIPGRPAIVRIDWIEAVVTAGGDPVPQVLRWETPEEISGLFFAECDYLGGNIVEFEYAYSALWLPLAARSGAPVSCAHISVAFAMLPRSRAGLEPPVPPAEHLTRLSGRALAAYRRHGVTGLFAGAKRVTRRMIAGAR